MGSNFIKIEPFNMANLNTNSYDLTLCPEIQVYKHSPLDPMNPETFETRTIIIPEDGLLLEKGKCYLARTNEYTITQRYVPTLQGKSGIGRMFLSVCSQAGYGDIGFAGYWTLQLVPSYDVVIYPNMKICQIQYETVEGSLVGVRYNGHYQNSDKIEASKIHEDFTNKSIKNRNWIRITEDEAKAELKDIKKQVDEMEVGKWLTADKLKNIPKDEKVVTTPPDGEIHRIKKKYGSKKSKTNKKLE